MVDQEGKRTEYGYDVLGRLTSVKDAPRASHVLPLRRDGQLHPPNRRQRPHHPLRLRRPRAVKSRRTLPDGAAESFQYDLDGTLLSHTGFHGIVRRPTYDAIGRLIENNWSNGVKESFTYSPTGQRLTAVDERGGTTRYEYDAQDRVIRKTDPSGHRLEYTYDIAGNRTSLTAIVGEEVLTTSYTYDALNRIDTVTDPEGGLYRFAYDANNRRERLEYPNGVVTTWSYDTQDRLVNLITSNAADEVLLSFHYTMAKTGHRTAVTEHDGTIRSYSYDDLWRLKSEIVRSGGTTAHFTDFVYGPSGNLLSQSSSIDSPVLSRIICRGQPRSSKFCQW